MKRSNLKPTKFLTFLGLCFAMTPIMGQYLRTDGTNSMTGGLKIQRADEYSSIELESNIGAFIDFKNNVTNDFDGRIIWNYNNSGRFDVFGSVHFLGKTTIGGLTGIGTYTPEAKLHIVENKVGDVNGMEETGVQLEIGRQKLLFKALRTANQTDWNNTTLKLQAVIDGTNHQSIDFVNDEAYREHVDIYTGNQVFSTRFYANGNVLIGKTSQNNSTYKLDVEGKVRANEIVVNTTGADYVFEEDYDLKSLAEVEDFIQENGHLPGVPPATKMQKEGMAISELNTKLLEKVEELTLYVIELKRENNQHLELIKNLQSEITQLKN